jgi:hypothetical protein
LIDFHSLPFYHDRDHSVEDAIGKKQTLSASDAMAQKFMDQTRHSATRKAVAEVSQRMQQSGVLSLACDVDDLDTGSLEGGSGAPRQSPSTSTSEMSPAQMEACTQFNRELMRQTLEDSAEGREQVCMLCGVRVGFFGGNLSKGRDNDSLRTTGFKVLACAPCLHKLGKKTPCQKPDFDPSAWQGKTS